MLLRKLSDYADRLDLPPEMYTRAPVRWLVDLDEQGKLLGFVQLTGTGKKNDPGKELEVPDLLVTSGDRPKLLAHKADYVLGVTDDPAKQERTNNRHRLFKELVGRCAERTREQSVQAVARFLATWDPRGASIPDGLNCGMTVTFRVGASLPVDLQSVREFWAAETAPIDAPTMHCIVCGQLRPVEKRLRVKAKRIPGGEKAGCAFISANEAAFVSHGLEASLVAPTCRNCAERFGHAANELLRNERTHIAIGPLAYVFWTREDIGFDVAALLAAPDAATVKSLMESAWRARETTAVDEAAFYATALSASGGRVVVRDWIEATIGQVKQNLARWFAMQRLVDAWGGEGTPVGIYSLAASLYPPKNPRIAPNVPKTLLRVALGGSTLPGWLMFEGVRREKAEAGRRQEPRRWPNRQRVVLLKMVLASSQWSLDKEDTMEQLDMTNRDPAYLCGRLMAEIEAIQRAAVPGAKATVIGRYFGTASSAPASVFGNLLRGAQSHLDKLRKEREGAYHALQKRLEEIMAPLESFPKTLALKEQALFSLGYYHQRAADRAAAKAHKELKDIEEALD